MSEEFEVALTVSGLPEPGRDGGYGGVPDPAEGRVGGMNADSEYRCNESIGEEGPKVSSDSRDGGEGEGE